MIKHVKFASIPVRDQSKALAFYTEKLGFEVVTDQPMDEGMRWIEVKPAGAETKVVLSACPEEADRIGTFSNVVFGTEDVRATYEELKAKGVEFIKPPTDEPWGVYAQFVDSEGNQLLLVSGC
ncbi:MAG TPA: VOC family protein [Blastocatellia bacterium]|nr:VOC family protein [Blastocatellia bacterium]